MARTIFKGRDPFVVFIVQQWEYLDDLPTQGPVEQPQPKVYILKILFKLVGCVGRIGLLQVRGQFVLSLGVKEISRLDKPLVIGDFYNVPYAVILALFIQGDKLGVVPQGRVHHHGEQDLVRI